MFKNQLQISTTSLWKHVTENFILESTENNTLKDFIVCVVVSAHVFI